MSRPEETMEGLLGALLAAVQTGNEAIRKAVSDGNAGLRGDLQKLAAQVAEGNEAIRKAVSDLRGEIKRLY